MLNYGKREPIVSLRESTAHRLHSGSVAHPNDGPFGVLVLACVIIRRGNGFVFLRARLHWTIRSILG